MSDEDQFWREVEARLEEEDEEDEEVLHQAMDALVPEQQQSGVGASGAAAAVNDEAVQAGPVRLVWSGWWHASWRI